MPFYDYQCKDCGAVFEVRATIQEKEGGLKPTCPECGGHKVRQRLSNVQMISGGRTSRCRGAARTPDPAAADERSGRRADRRRAGGLPGRCKKLLARNRGLGGRSTPGAFRRPRTGGILRLVQPGCSARSARCATAAGAGKRGGAQQRREDIHFCAAAEDRWPIRILVFRLA